MTTCHKGKLAARVRFMGRAGHSALALFLVNALYLANEFIIALRDVQVHLHASGVQDADYDVSYTTLHVRRISSGRALSAVPHHCESDFEIRHLAQDDPQKILQRLRDVARNIAAAAQNIAPEANIEIEVFNTYPGLDTPPAAAVVGFMKPLTEANGSCKVAMALRAACLIKGWACRRWFVVLGIWRRGISQMSL